MTSMEQRIRALEDRLGVNAPPECPECGTGEQVLIIREGEPEPICGTCHRLRCRGEGLVRIILVRDSEGEPA